MNQDTIDAFWLGQPDALKKAKKDALQKYDDGDVSSYHSILLSAYLSLISRVGILKKVYYFLCAKYHATKLLDREHLLGHNQIDVTLQFYIKQFTQFPRFSFLFENINIEKIARLMSKELDCLISADVKPHQKANALVTMAEFTALFYKHKVDGYFARSHPYFSDFAHHFMVGDVSYFVDSALENGYLVLNEGTEQSIRQWVRILKKCGELMEQYGKHKALKLLDEALILAKKHTIEDQEIKIKNIVARIESERSAG